MSELNEMTCIKMLYDGKVCTSFVIGRMTIGWLVLLTCLPRFGALLVSQMVKNLPTMWETWVLSLGWEDPLEEEMATHSSILAWRMPWTEESGGLQSGVTK